VEKRFQKFASLSDFNLRRYVEALGSPNRKQKKKAATAEAAAAAGGDGRVPSCAAYSRG
jgi:hypothetical protein